MKTVLAILGGAALIAAAILFTFRWEVNTDAKNPLLVYRLDRWTGKVSACYWKMSGFECDLPPVDAK
jgi:hypothetical protein